MDSSATGMLKNPIPSSPAGLSSAIASNLAKGFDLDTSVERAKKYISGALAAMLDLGKGSGPMDHGFAIKNEFTLSHDEITAEAADKEAK